MSRTDSEALEHGAFLQLFNTAARDLRGFLRRRLRRDDDADEVAQEALLRIWNSRENVDMETARPLLFRIASNLAIDRLREHRRWHFTEIDDAPPQPDGALADTISAERIVAAREELAKVEAAIAALPDNCRTAFLRTRIDGMKHADVAAEMGISKSMVEKHVAEAVYRLSLARLRP